MSEDGKEDPDNQLLDYKKIISNMFEQKFTTIHLDSEYIDDIEISQGAFVAIVSALVFTYGIQQTFELLNYIFGLPEAVAKQAMKMVRQGTQTVESVRDTPEFKAMLQRGFQVASSYPPDSIERTWVVNFFLLTTPIYVVLMNVNYMLWFNPDGTRTSKYAGISDEVRAEIDAGNYAWIKTGSLGQAYWRP